MKTKLKNIIPVLVVLFIYTFLQQCKHHPTLVTLPQDENGSTTTSQTTTSNSNGICFESEILPIFVSNCSMAGCHGNGSAADGVVLDNYNGIMNAGVTPGSPWASQVYWQIVSGQMPPAPHPPLSSSQTQLISDWISAGAQNTTNCATACDTVNVTYSNQIASIMSTNCVGCHNAGNASGGWDLSTYNGIVACINAGRFWGSVNWDTGFSPMPKNSNQLSLCDLRAIRIWLDNGNPKH